MRDAHALLGSVVRFVLDERVRDRIVAETRGNPLALLELPRGLTATQLAGGSGCWVAGVSGRIEESFVAAARGAPRRHAAAAADRGSGAGRRSSAACGARPSGSAIGVAAAVRRDRRSADDRRAGDVPPSARALGGVPVGAGARAPGRAPGAGGCDRPGARSRSSRVASRGGGAGPDEDVALELERSAGRAQARGGFAAAAAFMQRAVALHRRPRAPAGPGARRRAASLNAGAFDMALSLLAAAEAGPLDELQRARLDLLRAEAAYSQSRGSDAPPLLLRPPRPSSRSIRSSRVKRTSTRGARRCSPGSLRAAATCTMSPGKRCASAPRAADPPRPSDLLLDGFALLFTDGRAAAAPAGGQPADLPATTSRSRRCSGGGGLRPRRP